MIRNLRLAVRSLSRSPFVTAVAVVSLAFGIGANAAIFSLFHQMVMQPLPVEAPHDLVNLSAPGVKSGSISCTQAGDCDQVFSYPMFRDLEEIQTVFTGIAAHRAFRANLAYEGVTASGNGMLVSGSYFSVLGLQPTVGRLIGPTDDPNVGESAVVVLGHGYWQSRFGGDPAVLDDTMVINGLPFTIVGVAPEGFEGTTMGAQPRVYVPMTMRDVLEPRRAGNFDNRNAYWVYLFARLNPGIGFEGALASINGQYTAIINDVEAELQNMSDATLEQFRANEIGMAEGARGQSSMHDDTAEPLLLLNGVTALVLLIACANIANLLLSRAVGRSGEMAVRLSLGAERRHLIGQLMTESLVLAAAGGALGLLVSRSTLVFVRSMLPSQVAAAVNPELNLTVLGFTVITAFVSGIVFGIVPSLLSTRSGVLSSLKGQSGHYSGARSAAAFRAVLTTGQIALSMALLVAAGLFIRSLVEVSRIELGIDATDVVTFSISPERNGYEPVASRALFERTEDALASLPAISGVTAAMIPVLAGSNSGTNLTVEGYEADADTDTNASFNYIGPEFFQTLGIPLLAGREFTRTDVVDSPQVAIVNESFARKFELGRDVVGRRMSIGGGGPDLDIEIVGFVEDAKYSAVKGDIPPQFYLPYRQIGDVGSITFYARSEIEAREQLPAIAPLIARLDPNLPVDNVRTLRMQVEENTFDDRVISTLSTAFAVLASLLAAIGLYGVLSYAVQQRRREIGVRVALGAAPAKVRGLILRQMAVMTGVGGLIGLAGALAIGRAAESLLYEVSGFDPVVFALAATFLTVIALGAAAIPAYRAARVDPMLVLRTD